MFQDFTAGFGNLQQNITDATAAVLQYANIYGVGMLKSGPNDIYWSLSLEEQFYILLPIVVFIFRKKLKNYLVPFLFIPIVIQFFIHRIEWSMSWAVRTDSLMWGVILAIWSEKDSYRKFEPVFFKKSAILRWIVIGLSLAGMAYLPAKNNHITFSAGLVAMICAVLVWLASYNNEYLFKSGYLQKVLMWLGTRSYSLYLIHIIAYRFSYEIFYQLTPIGYRNTIDDSYILSAIAFPILFLCAEISYRYIEQPFRKLGLRIAERFIF